MRQISDEEFLTHLQYRINEESLEALQKIKKNTAGFEKIASHILALDDKLRLHDSFVGMSSSVEYLKIKNNESNEEEIRSINETIFDWAKKYKVDLDKVSGKYTYYIMGFEK
jgi:hypothetical protein